MGIDLLRYKAFRRLGFSRTLRPFLLLLSLTAFTAMIVGGIFGTPVGNRNAAIVLIWILWFSALMILLIPLGGRIWCLACPIPAVSEWISRLSMVIKSERIINLGLKWPERFNNIWLQNFAFLSVAVFSPLIFTRPAVTAYALLIFVLLAVVLDLSFKKSRPGRMFCRYLCPIGGFVGLYSGLGALEVRSRDKGICKNCTYRTCLKGNERGYGCPWLIYPGGLEKNTYCGVCLECIKSCAYENMTVQTRRPGKDLLHEPRLDEAFKGFIMLGSAGVYTAAYFGWWNKLKDIIYFSGDIFLGFGIDWAKLGLFALLLLGISLVALPGLHLGFSWLSKKAKDNKESSLKKVFTEYAYFTAPLGFMAWVGFVAGMLMINGSYIIPSLSDPFGFGWNLFGTAGYKWTPYLSGFVPYVQVFFLLLGSMASAALVFAVSKKHLGQHAFKSSLPFILEIAVLTFLLTSMSIMP